MNEDIKYLAVTKTNNLNFLLVGYFLCLLVGIFCFCLMFRLCFIYPF